MKVAEVAAVRLLISFLNFRRQQDADS